MCGEYFHTAVATATIPGSPPRVRGILENEARAYAHYGITPACAGNTPREVLEAHGYEDHPRVCGEYTFFIMYALLGLGSPPRVRGIRI